jgi:hypothetical protein
MRARFTWGFAAVLVLGGCFYPDDFPIFINARYEAPDFAVGEGGQPPALELEGLAPSEEARLALRGAMHVWNVRSRSEIPGVSSLSATSFLSFIPESPLEDGWYVIAADLSGLLEDPLQNREIQIPRGYPVVWGEGDRLLVYSRFYVGSAPVWHGTDLRNDYVDTSAEILTVSATTFSALVAQTAPLDAEEGDVAVSYDGIAQSCLVSWAQNAFVARCPPVTGPTVTGRTSVAIVVSHPTLSGLWPGEPTIHSFVAPADSPVLRDRDLGVDLVTALAEGGAP